MAKVHLLTTSSNTSLWSIVIFFFTHCFLQTKVLQLETMFRAIKALYVMSQHTHTHTRLTALVWEYLGEPVPEKKNQSGFY